MVSSSLANALLSSLRAMLYVRACEAHWSRWQRWSPPEIVNASWWSMRDAREDRLLREVFK
jgi:hypothetical protein